MGSRRIADEGRARARQGMTVGARLLGGLGVLVLAVVILAACSTDASGVPGGPPSVQSSGAGSGANLASNHATPSEPGLTNEPSRAPGPSPVEVVQDFYDWYLEGRSMAEVVARPELSPALVEFLGGFDEPYDPFTCTEAVPATVLAVTSSFSGRTAIVSTMRSPDRSSFESGPPVDMVVSPKGEWQLQFVGCSG